MMDIELRTPGVIKLLSMLTVNLCVGILILPCRLSTLMDMLTIENLFKEDK